jgi:bifunctional enzyme CysN/CysC
MSADQELIKSDVESYLRQHEQKELLRFVAVGSVDDGKSTLIGRLLHDTHGLYEDQLEAVKKASIKGATRGAQADSEIDFSLFTDGLKAEREQGITIDVAYRYFSTSKRKFIIADTPGHVQYTRNMATGASTANVAIILIDARLGILPQSRRHAFIASLLGIPHLVVCVNKMDLRDYDRGVFDTIRAEFTKFTSNMSFHDVTFIPISALRGDNVVHNSEKMSWWKGGTLLHTLETMPIAGDRNLQDFRYPVQYVIRPDLTYRGFASQIPSGVVRVGDEVMALPSKKRSKIASIDTFEGPREEAFAPMSVSLRLADEIDVSRGDMLVRPDNLPNIGDRFDAMVVWMSERPLDPDKSYLLKHTARIVRAQIDGVQSVIDPETLAPHEAKTLQLNDIAKLTLKTAKPLFYDPYAKNRGTGSFILIDSLTNDTVAAGMIVEATTTPPLSRDRQGAGTQVSDQERRGRLGQTGASITVQSTELAYLLERHLFDEGRVATVLGNPAAQNSCAAAGLIAIAITDKTTINEDPITLDGDDPEQQAAQLVEALRRRGTWDGG